MTPSAAPRTALVTGASAGIGQAFCRQLAAQGYDIVAVARRTDRLTALAEELARLHQVRVTALSIDLSAADAIGELLGAVRNIDIEVLINNAGYGVPGRYTSSPWSVHARFHSVMTTAVA